MNISGEYLIAAGRQRVWDAVNNPEILRQCIPGCEEIIQSTPTDWTAKVVARVGPVRARFAGKLSLQDIREPEHCKIVGEGSGGAAGYASGSADIDLIEQEGGTLLRYSADTEIGGKLAQIGSRLIDSFVKKYADDFFAKFSELVATDAGALLAPSFAPQAVAAPAGAPPAPVATPVHATVPAYASQTGLPQKSGSRFDAQTFTILVLASLLVFMTVMFAMKS